MGRGWILAGQVALLLTGTPWLWAAQPATKRVNVDPTPWDWSAKEMVPGSFNSAQATCAALGAFIGETCTYRESRPYFGYCYTDRNNSCGVAFHGRACPAGTNWDMPNHDMYHPFGPNPSDYRYGGDDLRCWIDAPLATTDTTREDAPCDANGAGPAMGNPIVPLTGAKRQRVDLGVSIGWMDAVLTYDSSVKLPTGQAELAGGFGDEPNIFGELWRLNLLRSLVVLADGKGARAIRGDGRVVNFTEQGTELVARAGVRDRLVRVGSGFRYVDVAGEAIETYDAQGKLNRVDHTSGAWLVYEYSTTPPDLIDPTAEPFPQGGLWKITDNNERALSFGPYTVNDGYRVACIRDRQEGYGPCDVALAYDLPNGGNLSGITWYKDKRGTPESSFTQSFLYEKPELPWALTGIVDGNGQRHSTYDYAADGRAISTELAGGVNRYSVSYSRPPQVQVVDSFDPVLKVVSRARSWAAVPQGITVRLPNGTDSTLTATLSPVGLRFGGSSQPAGSGCLEASSRHTYDAAGNMLSSDDFNGHRTCFANSAATGLESARVEGLPKDAVCSTVLPVGAAIPAGSRKVSSEYSLSPCIAPIGDTNSDGIVNSLDLAALRGDFGDGGTGLRSDLNNDGRVNALDLAALRANFGRRKACWTWDRRTRVAEPKLRTTYVYHGTLDPQTGQTASCAPGSAAPRILLCKRIEQATTDADGHLGLAANLDTRIPARIHSWTYNDVGQVLTATDGNNTVRRFSYFTDSTDASQFFDTGAWFETNHVINSPHTKGDLESFSTGVDAHKTMVSAYNIHGQPRRVVDPNGVTTEYFYDLRKRLVASSVLVGGKWKTTEYSWHRTGQLKRVTQPDQTWVEYGYDDAHRLTRISDSAGNVVDYTLDAFGARVGETRKDPQGLLSRAISIIPDALGRVEFIKEGVLP